MIIAMEKYLQNIFIQHGSASILLQLGLQYVLIMAPPPTAEEERKRETKRERQKGNDRQTERGQERKRETQWE